MAKVLYSLKNEPPLFCVRVHVPDNVVWEQMLLFCGDEKNPGKYSFAHYWGDEPDRLRQEELPATWDFFFSDPYVGFEFKIKFG